MNSALRWIVVLAVTGLSPALLAPSPAQARESVSFSGKAEPGTIVVRTSERRLYYIVGNGRAIRYPVGVGRDGKKWYGTTRIVNKALKPGWTPPDEIRGGRPAWVIPGGSPKNPMGAGALVLADHELAIHGTNNPGSIGGFVSWGCIRMHNADILDLFDRVGYGTQVVIAH
jgi:lipoprotein-anchoring transpeptidase ErfK/SrfK